MNAFFACRLIFENIVESQIDIRLGPNSIPFTYHAQDVFFGQMHYENV